MLPILHAFVKRRIFDFLISLGLPLDCKSWECFLSSIFKHQNPVTIVLNCDICNIQWASMRLLYIHVLYCFAFSCESFSGDKYLLRCTQSHQRSKMSCQYWSDVCSGEAWTWYVRAALRVYLRKMAVVVEGFFKITLISPCLSNSNIKKYFQLISYRASVLRWRQVQANSNKILFGDLCLIVMLATRWLRALQILVM